MASKSGQLSAFAIFLLIQAHCISCFFNDCNVKLDVVDVNGAESPIILRYQDARQPRNFKIFHPEYLDSDCLIRNLYIGNGLVSFTCLQHQLQFPGLENWLDNVSTTSLIGAHQGIAYDNFTVITPEHPSSISFEKMSGPVKCSGAVEPSMKKIDDGKYQVGYQMNALDFLPIFGLTMNNQSTFAHAKILSIINRRPRIDETNETLRKGQVLKDLPGAPSQLGGKHHLALKIKEMLKNKFSNKNTVGDNHLVYGQLLSKDDLFYIPEQRATFFLENSALIWKSINDGNWKIIGDIVRKIAYETVTDLDVYSGTLECLNFNKTPIYLHNSSDSTKQTCVPKFLFKIALDKRSWDRGIVFITVNDPSMPIADDGSIPSDYELCDKKPECDKIYPEFSSPKKGYTYCCDLKDFEPWTEIQMSSVESDIPDFTPYYPNVPFNHIGPPPPPPPMPPMPARPMF